MEPIERDELSESPIDLKEYYYFFKSWARLITLASLLAGVPAVYSFRPHHAGLRGLDPPVILLHRFDQVGKEMSNGT